MRIRDHNKDDLAPAALTVTVAAVAAGSEGGFAGSAAVFVDTAVLTEETDAPRGGGAIRRGPARSSCVSPPPDDIPDSSR